VKEHGNKQLPDEMGCNIGALLLLFNKLLDDEANDEPVGELIELIARPPMPGSAPIELSAASPAPFPFAPVVNCALN
jgi:hypothetical protein